MGGCFSQLLGNSPADAPDNGAAHADDSYEVLVPIAPGAKGTYLHTECSRCLVFSRVWCFGKKNGDLARLSFAAKQHLAAHNLEVPTPLICGPLIEYIVIERWVHGNLLWLGM